MPRNRIQCSSTSSCDQGRERLIYCKISSMAISHRCILTSDLLIESISVGRFRLKNHKMAVHIQFYICKFLRIIDSESFRWTVAFFLPFVQWEDTPICQGTFPINFNKLQQGDNFVNSPYCTSFSQPFHFISETGTGSIHSLYFNELACSVFTSCLFAHHSR